MDLDLQEFLLNNRIDREDWGKSNISWELLLAIAKDHENNKSKLLQTAEMFAKVIQFFPSVHSVRWRVKDTSHLIEKIIRKRAEQLEGSKYIDISLENYFTIVTDLVGIRAMHLFKKDCFEIDDYLRNSWECIERPSVYTRDGDDSKLLESFLERDFDIRVHPAGYRSVHYVFKSRPLQREVITEVQVRTIFEEAWSEIDHHVRYPNFSDDELVSYFLTIFNRLSGSADEMGSFVQSLTQYVDKYNKEIKEAQQEKMNAISRMEMQLTEIENLRQQDNSSKEYIKDLKNELNKLKRPEAYRNLISELGILGNSFDKYSAISKQSEALKNVLGPSSSPQLLDLSNKLKKILE